MLKKLARYAGEGDGPVIFRLVSLPFLNMGALWADFQSFGKRSLASQRLCRPGLVTGQSMMELS